MSRANPYADLCLEVQALRRDAERSRAPIVPALGIAASAYTHQLANTWRILTDVRVRHLLADEVGLGKTVQALMILNALRSARRELRALVIVPDRLYPQWRDEIMARAHTAPIENEAQAERSQYIRLRWEGLLRMTDDEGRAHWAVSEIDPAKYDVLVVDELHRLRADLQDRIVRTAPDFEHVIVLSATPAFRRPERHAQLFAIIEPERSTIARWEQVSCADGVAAGLSIDENLSRWPEWATRGVVGSLLKRDNDAADAAGDDDEPRTSAALVHCAYRRVIRTRRVDYSGILPCRRHVQIVIEPLGAEAERQAIMWRYLGHLGDFSTRVDAVLLAKRVILSPPSLRRRLDELRRSGHDRDDLLEQVRPLVQRRQGDSRLDALVDLLARAWSADPTDRVLVAAQDNPTVDYLLEMVKARLPVIGPLTNRIKLVASAIRQGQAGEMSDDLAAQGNETAENLDKFQRGDAQILFAPEAAQVGLNLQRARILVLYSVPWRPEEVEQWIGRLDRIGNSAAFSTDGEARSVDVYTIAQRGLVDEKIIAVLRRFNVFERSVNLDGSHLEEVARLIETAALSPQSARWSELANATEAMAEEDEVQELASPLREWLPWTVDWARAVRHQVEALAPAEPVLVKLSDDVRGGPPAWARALDGMVTLLKRAGEYHIRENRDPYGGRFRTLWYRFSEGGRYSGGKELMSRVVLSCGADPHEERHPRHAFAFITRRGDIASPPRRRVFMRVDESEYARPLHFLDFGNAVHDELVQGWLPTEVGTRAIRVELFGDHSFFKLATSGVYLLRVSVLDAAEVLDDAVRDRALERMAWAAASTQPDRLPALLEPFRRRVVCALEADRRWLTSLLHSVLELDGLRFADGHWSSVAPELVGALLDPMAHGRSGLPLSRRWDPSSAQAAAASDGLARLRSTDDVRARRAWSHRFPALEHELRSRLAVVRAERHDAETVAGLALEDGERRLEETRGRGNRAQITRAEAALAADSDALAITQAIWGAREDWLRQIPAVVREHRSIERLTALVQVARAP